MGLAQLPAAAVLLLRIADQARSSSQAHSGAPPARISFWCDAAGWAHLEIVANGWPAHLTATLQEKVTRLGGTLVVSSRGTGGTCVQVAVPLGTRAASVPGDEAGEDVRRGARQAAQKGEPLGRSLVPYAVETEWNETWIFAGCC